MAIKCNSTIIDILFQLFSLPAVMIHGVARFFYFYLYVPISVCLALLLGNTALWTGVKPVYIRFHIGDGFPYPSAIVYISINSIQFNSIKSMCCIYYECLYS